MVFYLLHMLLPPSLPPSAQRSPVKYSSHYGASREQAKRRIKSYLNGEVPETVDVVLTLIHHVIQLHGAVPEVDGSPLQLFLQSPTTP